MGVRGAVLLAALTLASSAEAGEYLKPEEARQFVAEKLFSYTCFEGTTGVGRIHADGSVVGSIRVRGQGVSHFVALPPGTIRVNSSAICASVRGMPMQPCFNVERIDANSFRGSVSGLGFAYCDFRRTSPRVQSAEAPINIRAKISARIRPATVKSAEANEGSEQRREPELHLRPSKSE